MITKKSLMAIKDEAIRRSEQYEPVEPWDMNTPPQYHFKYGFEQGARWATEKMSEAVLKVINK